MGESIKGSKSKLYIKESIPNATVESADNMQHVTVQELMGNRAGMDVVIHGTFRTHAIAKLVAVGSVKRKLVVTAHGAKKGDILYFNTGSAQHEEVSIIGIEDANTLYLSSEVNASIGDEVFVMRHVTPSYDEDGSLNVSVVPSPIAYNTKTGGSTTATTVLEDLDTPLDSKPLPVKDSASIALLGTIDADTSKVASTITTEGGAQPANVMAVGGNDGSGVSKQLKTDTDGTLQANIVKSDLIGAINETAPATDIASSGLNGRLQRIAQNISSLIGKLPASLGAKLGAASLSVVQASDVSFNVKPNTITNEYDEKLAVTTVETFIAPANAIGAKIMLIDSIGTTGNLRFKMGGVATDSSGLQVQAGRSEDLIGGSDISVCAESGTCEVAVIWSKQA